MTPVLVHGCFDLQTLETLKGLGVRAFAFDLRPESLNLVTIRDLKKCLKILSTEEVFLTVGNESQATIDSVLDLLKETALKFTLLFRGDMKANNFVAIERSFFWMFNPDAEWKKILRSPRAKGVFLPLKFQQEYHRLPELWSIIEEYNLEVFLHAESFQEGLFLNLKQGMNLSIDLSKEVEKTYRNIDQTLLRSMKIWSRLNEHTDL